MSDYVPPRPSTPEQSGGFGFTYADRVAARLLLAMLASEMPLGAAAGVPVDVRFEQRPAGELFDDLVVRSDAGVRWSVTVKSGDVVVGTIDKDLVARAWWMLDNPPADATANDVLVIAQPPVGVGVRRTFDDLVAWSVSQAPNVTAEWLATDYVGNDPKRAMWDSVRSVNVSRDPQVLLARLRLLTFDLDPMLAPDMSEVRRVAESVLDVPERWQELWDGLLTVAAESRGRAAQMSVDKIIVKLPRSLVLRGHGDADEDLAMLRAWGASQAPRNRQIGGVLELNTKEDRLKLDGALAEKRFVLLTGESGVGKSVTLAQWCEANGGIYLRADALTSPADSLRSAGTRRPLNEILRLLLDRELLFVIDQIDRLDDEISLGNVAMWVAALLKDERVRIIFGCALGAAPIQRLHIGRMIKSELKDLRIERDLPTMLGAIRESFPEFAAILKDYAPSPLLATPRALDELLAMGVAVWPETYADFLDLVWIRRIQGGKGDSAARAAARRMAEQEADAGTGHLIDDTDVTTVANLRGRGVIQDDGRHMTWDHDSTGDHIRAIMLSEETDERRLSERLGECVLNPFWRRALRLHCVAVLERDGVEGFERLMAATTANEDAELLQAALYDAVVFCPAKMRMPERLGELLARDTNLMERFVRRFLYSAADAVGFGMDGRGLQLRAHLRQPVWSRWLPTARMVLAQKEWFARDGVDLGLQVLVPYLEAVGENDFLGAAPFALILSYRTLGFRRRAASEENVKPLAFRAAIAALRFIPASARKFLRRCVGRVGPVMKAPSDQELRRMFISEGPFIGAYPLGPKNRIDDDFQEFYLNGDWPGAVAKQDPALARELFYACCIREPGPMTNMDARTDELCGFTTAFNLPFLPATHLNPSVNAFFDHSFEEGLELVATLVNFATETWLAQYEDEGIGLSIVWGEEERFFAGDASVYHWADGSAVGSYVLQSLLLTLERRLLDTEDDDELTKRAKQVLERTNNLALLSVLIFVAKARNHLFLGLLDPVLFDDVIDTLDIRACTVNAWRYIGGMWGRSEWWRNQEEQLRFSRLPHRRQFLRYFAPFYVFYGDQETIRKGRERWLTIAEEAEADHAHMLRLLASIYDRENLTVEQMDGQVAITTTMPDELAMRARAVQEESLNSVRATSIDFNAKRMLTERNYAEAPILYADLERAKLMPDRFGRGISSEIGAYLVFLVAARVGVETLAGDANICRDHLLRMIRAQLNKGDEPPTFDDEHHWTSLIAENAPIVFGIPPADSGSREALLAFIQCAAGPAIHRFVRAVFTVPDGPATCLMVLQIARIWAAESARRHQQEWITRQKLHLVPSAIDLDYDDKSKMFILNGVWPDDRRLALGRTAEGSRDDLQPSNYEWLLAGLLEYLERSTNDAQIAPALFLLEDVLEGVLWRKNDRDYDEHRIAGWRLIGGVLPNLPDAAVALVLAKWVPEAQRGDTNALLAIASLLESYARGIVSLQAASETFLSLVKAVEKDGEVAGAFYECCLGITSHGSVNWETDKAELWIERHRAIYGAWLPKALARGDSEKVLRRLRRSEFRPLDSVLFEALTTTNGNTKFSASEAESLSELMIPFSKIAKGSAEMRGRWRRLLARLEKKGGRLAWQILAEVADKV